MNIVFDVSQTENYKSGCGYFAQELIYYLAQLDKNNQYFLHRNFGKDYWNEHYADTIQIKNKNFHEGLFYTSHKEYAEFWQQSIEKIEKYLNYPSIFHSNNFFCPDERLKQGKFVYTLYDLTIITNPQWTTEENRILCFDGIYRASLYADHVIAISERTRADFLKYFPYYAQDKITIVYPSSRFCYVDNIAKPETLRKLMPKQYWLNVSTLEPRKNHKRLLRAYAKLKKEKKANFPLVFVGKTGWMMEDIYKFSTKLGLEQDLIWLGYVNDEELQWLYQNCFCFIYPSLYEGFGMPVLEALSLGTLVITSRIESISEVVEDTVILIDPYEIDTLFLAMLDVVNENYNIDNFKKNSMLQANKFSWLKSAELVINLYEDLMLGN